jgi:hypothetical protein
MKLYNRNNRRRNIFDTHRFCLTTADDKSPVVNRLPGFLFLPRSTMLRVKLSEENSMGWESFRSTGFAGGIDNRKLKPSIHEDRAKGDYISFKPNNHEAKNPTSVLTGVSLSGSFLLA